jgi:GDP-L-fucose synthase
MCSHINVGSGKDLTIKELSQLIKEVVNYQGDIEFDTSKPDGTPRKFLQSKVLNNLGWCSKISLRDGLLRTYNDFIKNYANF